jgi:hypothetical protein
MDSSGVAAYLATIGMLDAGDQEAELRVGIKRGRHFDRLATGQHASKVGQLTGTVHQFFPEVSTH